MKSKQYKASLTNPRTLAMIKQLSEWLQSQAADYRKNIKFYACCKAASRFKDNAGEHTVEGVDMLPYLSMEESHRIRALWSLVSSELHSVHPAKAGFIWGVGFRSGHSNLLAAPAQAARQTRPAKLRRTVQGEIERVSSQTHTPDVEPFNLLDPRLKISPAKHISMVAYQHHRSLHLGKVCTLVSQIDILGSKPIKYSLC